MVKNIQSEDALDPWVKYLKVRKIHASLFKALIFVFVFQWLQETYTTGAKTELMDVLER